MPPEAHGQCSFYRLRPALRPDQPTLLACVALTRSYRKIVVTDDVHHVRIQSVLEERQIAPEKIGPVVDYLRHREQQFYSAADVVLTVSEEDGRIVQGLVAADRRPAPLVQWLMFVAEVPTSETWMRLSHVPFAQRQGMLYVGNTHAIAVHSLKWLVSETLPLVAKVLRRAGLPQDQRRFTLGGPRWSLQVGRQGAITSTAFPHHWLESPPLSPLCGTCSFGWQIDHDLVNTAVERGVNFQLMESPTDQQLERLYSSHRVFVAPLLNGTGVATKVINAMAHGIPVVTTEEGTHGIYRDAEVSPPIAVANTPQGFALRVLEIMTNATLWRSMSLASVDFIQRYHSTSALDRHVRELMVSSTSSGAVR